MWFDDTINYCFVLFFFNFLSLLSYFISHYQEIQEIHSLASLQNSGKCFFQYYSDIFQLILLAGKIGFANNIGLPFLNLKLMTDNMSV